LHKDFGVVEILILEVDLVSLATGATVDRFSCRSDQVDLHLSFFQLHGLIFIFIATFNLKNESLSRPKKIKSTSFTSDEERAFFLQKHFRRGWP
jgi:hypothetical protein